MNQRMTSTARFPLFPKQVSMTNFSISFLYEKFQSFRNAMLLRYKDIIQLLLLHDIFLRTLFDQSKILIIPVQFQIKEKQR